MSQSERDYLIGKLCLNRSLGRSFQAIIFGFSDVTEMRRQLATAKVYSSSVNGLNVYSTDLDGEGARRGLVAWSIASNALRLFSDLKDVVRHAETIQQFAWEDLPTAPVALASRAVQKTVTAPHP